MMKAGSSGKAAMLRHRFASVEQLRAHVHAVDGAALIFFRDPGLQLASGTPALLEITFDSSEETRVLRTSVLARAEGAGLWLAMPHARFLREVHERGMVARKGRRLLTDRFLRLKRASGGEHLVALLDLSMAGARIGGGVPSSLAREDVVELKLASTEPGESAELGSARVAWSEDGEAGLEFDRKKESCRTAVAKLFRTLEATWRVARDTRHLDICCRNGALLEPPVPRVRIDGKRDAQKVG